MSEYQTHKTMNYAEEIKEAVTMRQAAELYGVRVNKQGYAMCPFHNEKTGSMRIYPTSYHCFGCGANGDVISLVRGLYNLSFIEACSKLNNDFVLGLPIDHKPTREQRKKADQMAAKRRRAWEAKKRAVEDAKSAYDRALTLWAIFDTFVRKNAPKSQLDPLDDKWVTAVHFIGFAEWNLEQAEIALYEAEHTDPYKELNEKDRRK